MTLYQVDHRLASGNVPDMSTALPAQVAEMINADALTPINDLIDDIGRDKFAEAAISEGTMDGNNYSVPLYRHAHVMWIRKDLLEKNGLRPIRFHDLRHSCASLLLANGVPMKQIQEWLGHSDFSTTANIYAHLDYASKLSSAQAMLECLGYGNASA